MTTGYLQGKLVLISVVSTLTFGLSALPTRADVDFHFPIGISYASGLTDVTDAIETGLENQYGFGVDTFSIPVGLSLHPYIEFDFGLGVGLSIGPAQFVAIEVDTYGPGFSTSDSSFDYLIPVGADLRYTLFRDRSVSPYARVGFRYPIVGGDYLEDSSPGIFGALGVEFYRNKKVGFGIEFGYDTSEVDVSVGGGVTETVKPCEFMISIFALF
jgi:hypothetical protein